MPLVALDYTYGNTNTFNFASGTFDWNAGVAHLFTAGPRINDFDIISRTELYENSSFNIYGNFQATTICTGSDGRVYSGTTDNAHLIQGYNPQTQTIDKNFDNTGLPNLTAVGYLTTIDFGGRLYVCAAALTAGIVGAQIWVVNMTDLSQTGFNQAVTEHYTGIAPGNARVCKAGPGQAFVAAIDGLASAFIGFYIVTVSGTMSVAMNRIGQQVPTNFDAAATKFMNVFVPNYSATDGHILSFFQTDVGSWLAKLSKVDASLIWKVSVNNAMDLGECSVKHDRLYLITPGNIAGNFQYYVFDTNAGAVLSLTPENVLGNFAGCTSNDTYQMLVDLFTNVGGFANWATFGPPPAPAIAQSGVQRRG